MLICAHVHVSMLHARVVCMHAYAYMLVHMCLHVWFVLTCACLCAYMCMCMGCASCVKLASHGAFTWGWVNCDTWTCVVTGSLELGGG